MEGRDRYCTCPCLAVSKRAWTFTYDAAGNLATKTNPRAKTTTYAYDNLSRLTSETDPLGYVRSYAYDAASRLTSRTDPKSQVIAYGYNNRDELTLIDYPTGTDTTFAYNDSGARTSMVDATGTTSYAYDNLYRLTSVTFPGSRVVSYGYDDASRRTSVAYPGGVGSVVYGYDNVDRLASVTDWNGNAISYAYDDSGRMTSKTLPSGTAIVSTYSYDNADRLTNIAHVKSGSTTIASVAYTLDAVGDRTQRVDQQGTHTYAYDNAYRLTSVTYPGPSTTSYSFDAFGNRLTKTDGTGTTNYAYDNNDRITSVTPPSASAVNYTWDNNGNLTARGSDNFAWDVEDRMTSATVGGATTSFVYRGDGLRNSLTSGGTTTTFTWDINAGLPVVLDDGNQYVYAGSLESMKTGGAWYYYLADGLGSTMAVVDGTGTVQASYTYDVYGKATKTGTLANSFDFAGQQTDATGLQYLRARYMDPETGTFLSREPLARFPGWTGNPLGYAGGSPVGLVDPTGLVPVEGDGPGGCGGCDPGYGGEAGPQPGVLLPPRCSAAWCYSRPTRAYASDRERFAWVEYQFNEDGYVERRCALTREYSAQPTCGTQSLVYNWDEIYAILQGISPTAADLFWNGLSHWRGKTKTNGESGKNKRYYEWDYRHGEVEVYDQNGKHLGSLDPKTGAVKPNSREPGRDIDIK